MSLSELEARLETANQGFSENVQKYLNTCACDSDTFFALDTIAHQMFETLQEFKDAIVDYERNK